MHANFNKHNKLCPCISDKLHHFWQEIRRIKVIKCPPPNYSPQGDMHSNPSCNLKNNSNTNANLTMKWFTLRLGRTLCNIYQN